MSCFQLKTRKQFFVFQVLTKIMETHLTQNLAKLVTLIRDHIIDAVFQLISA